MAANLDTRIQYDPHNYLNVERVKKTSPPPARNTGACKLAGVFIGLMCIVQGTLNIVLRLYPIFPEAVGICNNHTLSVDTEKLQSMYNKLVSENRQLQIDYINLGKLRDNLQKETDNLQTKLANINADIRKPGWISFKSSLYYVSTEERSWTESRQDCKREGADLVIIKSRDEQDFIEMLRRGRKAWIGLTDREKKGTWKWVDGTESETFFWWTREPNNLNGNEDCVVTGYEPTDGRPVLDVLRTWNDESCPDRAFWICEKTISL